MSKTKEITTIVTVQFTDITKATEEVLEKWLEDGDILTKAAIEQLRRKGGFDDAVILDRKDFVRDVEEE